MPKKPVKRSPVIKDWHLWSQVTQTVAPLSSTVPFEKPDPPTVQDSEKLLNSVAQKVGLPVKKSGQKSKFKGPTAPSYSPPVSMPSARGKSKFPTQILGKEIEPGMRKRLVRGHIAIDGTLDLHGMRQHEAHAALVRFISARYAKGDRTLLIITGKGLKTDRLGDISERGILRHMLPRWLVEHQLAPMIAGWEISAQTHGGDGAYYVRLRRSEK